MPSLKTILPIVPILALGAWASVTWPKAPEAPALVQDAANRQGRLVQLWAGDDISCSLDASTGRSGTIFLDGQLDLSQATLVYDRLQKEHLSIGLARNSLIALINLGPLTVVPKPDPRANGFRLAASLFNTLRIERDRLVYDMPGSVGQELRPATRILRASPEAGPIHVKPSVGDVLLARYLREGRHASKAELIKLLVVAHEPGVRLTLRWGLLN